MGCCDLGRRAALPAERPGVARRLETAATLAKSTCVDCPRLPSRRRPTSHGLLRPRSPGSPAGRAPGSGPAVRNRGHPRKVHLRGLSQSAAGRLRMGCCDLGRRVPPTNTTRRPPSDDRRAPYAFQLSSPRSFIAQTHRRKDDHRRASPTSVRPDAAQPPAVDPQPAHQRQQRSPARDQRPVDRRISGTKGAQGDRIGIE